MTIEFLRPKAVFQRRGRPRSSTYEDVKNGLLTPPIKLSARATAWPIHEINAICAAQLAGATTDEIRALVKRLVAARKAAA